MLLLIYPKARAEKNLQSTLYVICYAILVYLFMASTYLLHLRRVEWHIICYGITVVIIYAIGFLQFLV